jgi:hypothetical protein
MWRLFGFIGHAAVVGCGGRTFCRVNWGLALRGGLVYEDVWFIDMSLLGGAGGE